MKKTIAILLVLTMVLSMIPLSGVFAATATTLYLKPSSNWKQSNARFAAYFFGNGEKWVSMTDTDKDGIYEVTVPAGYPNVIFCRMNPSASANNWNNRWNQTADLKVPTNGTDLYTVKEGTWDKGGGTWSVYGSSGEGGSVTPPPADPVYIIAGYPGLCGSDWNPSDTNNQLTDPDDDGTYSITFTGIAAGDYEFKITTDGSYPEGDNKKITVAAAGDVTISYNPTSGDIQLSGATWYVEPAVLTVDSVYAVGNGNIFSTGEWLNGENWVVNAATNKMTETSEGIWEITYQNVPATVDPWFNVKFAINGGWGDNFGGAGVTSGVAADATHNPPEGGHVYFNLTQVSDVALKLDLTNYDHATKSGAKYTVTITPVVYTFTVTPEGGTESEKTAFGEVPAATLTNQAVGSYTVKLYRNDVLADTKTVEVASANSSICIAHDASALTAYAQAHTYSVTVGSESKDLVLGADNKYSFTFENVAAGTYEYIIMRDGTADMGNVNVTVEKNNSKVIITFDPRSSTPVSYELTAPATEYYVSGIGGWDAKQNPMENNGDGTHTFTVNLAAGTYQFKVTNGTWNDGGSWPADNFTFEVSEACDVTIKFAEDGNVVSMSGTHAKEVTELAVNFVFVAGNGSGNWLAGKSWVTNADENKMTGNNGIYEITYQNVAAGTGYKFKFAIDGAWTHSFGGASFTSGTASDAVYNGSDISFDLAEASDVTIQLDLSNYNHADKSGAKFTVTITKSDSDDQGGGTTPPPATDDTYHVVGEGAIFDQSWAAADATKMEKQADGSYKKVFTNVTKGSVISIKVVKNSGASGEAWIPDGMGNEQNVEVTADNGTITITYKPGDEQCTISGDVKPYTAPSGDDDDDDQDGTVTPPASTYYVAGNSDLTGANWSANDSNNLMTAAGNKFSKTYTGLQPGKKYEFKITDGTWNNSWGIGDSKSDNYVFAVSAASSVTITFDPATKEISVTGDKLTDYVPEVTSATVVGSKGLCGGAADWATENDGAMVKGTDGKFTKVFSNVAAGNYECKVLTNNGDWYPGSNVSVAVSANGSTVTVTFDPAAGTVTASVKAPEGGDQGDDDDNQGGTVTPPPATNDVYHVVGSGSIFAADWTIADADKMEKQSDGTYKKVYTGVAKGKLGIKVVKNNTTWIPDGFDNEIKAEVTADNSTVTVTYNPSTGKIDVKINNKDAGSASGTPEGGNQGGSQGGSSTVKEITIYAKVPASWTAPKVWAWKGTQNVATSAWPGNLNMTKGANGWWSIKITSDIEGVLICNESGSEQTTDVKVTTSGANIYITVGEKQADGKYAATSKFESVPSSGDETALFGMVIVMTAAVLGMGITVVNKKKFF